MTPPLRRRDLACLLGTAGAAALAVSLGADATFAAEVGLAIGMILLTGVLLRLGPVQPTRARPATRDDGAHAAARRGVQSALGGRWGVQLHLRRVLREAVGTRLDLAGVPLEDVVAGLPEELVVLLTGRWEQDRGLTPDELDRVLAAVEDLDP